MNPLTKAWQDLGVTADDRAMEIARRYQAIFFTPEGQMCLEDLRQTFWRYHSTVDAENKFSPVNEGNRQVVLYIEKMLEADVMSGQISGPETD